MAIAAGFARPVHDAQGCFRTVMEAFSRPGLVKAFATALQPPSPLTPELAAIALTLADRDAPLWLDEPLRGSSAVAEFLRFHTGARIVERPADAAFALVSDAAALPELSIFAQGLDAYPDRSTTVVVAVEAFGSDHGALILRGPGVKGEARLAISPSPRGLATRLRANGARFPCGVDLLFAAPGAVAALPRSVQIAEAA